MIAILSLVILSAIPTAVQTQNLSVWDTRTSSAKPLAPAALKRTDGWTRIDRGDATAFKGDAVLSNGRLTAVFCKKGSGVELYTPAASRAVLRLLDSRGKPATRLRRLKITDHNRGAVRVEAAYGSVTAQFRIKRGEMTVEVSPVLM